MLLVKIVWNEVRWFEFLACIARVVESDQEEVCRNA